MGLGVITRAVGELGSSVLFGVNLVVILGLGTIVVDGECDVRGTKS